MICQQCIFLLEQEEIILTAKSRLFTLGAKGFHFLSVRDQLHTYTRARTRTYALSVSEYNPPLFTIGRSRPKLNSLPHSFIFTAPPTCLSPLNSSLSLSQSLNNYAHEPRLRKTAEYDNPLSSLHCSADDDVYTYICIREKKKPKERSSSGNFALFIRAVDDSRTSLLRKACVCVCVFILYIRQ